MVEHISIRSHSPPQAAGNALALCGSVGDLTSYRGVILSAPSMIRPQSFRDADRCRLFAGNFPEWPPPFCPPPAPTRSGCAPASCPFSLSVGSGCFHVGPESPQSCCRRIFLDTSVCAGNHTSISYVLAAENPISPVQSVTTRYGNIQSLQNGLGIGEKFFQLARRRFSGLANLTNSTLLNWCCRISPLVSFP